MSKSPIEDFHSLPGLNKILVQRNRFTIIIYGIHVPVLRFITTPQPVIGVRVSIGNGYGHVKSLYGGIKIFHMEICPSFFEVGISCFPVSQNTGIKLCNGSRILFHVGVVNSLNKEWVY